MYLIIKRCWNKNYITGELWIKIIKKNSEPAELIKQTCPMSILRSVHYQFWGHQDENSKLASQQYRARLHRCALYWWQRLFTYGSSRVKVKLVYANLGVKQVLTADIIYIWVCAYNNWCLIIWVNMVMSKEEHKHMISWMRVRQII